ncbi:MAG: efflux RND transporter permease subunit, partial [Cohaesibacteraceae bacterium]|nr:efflux RND transporter permease subunit [Cohaesibacteraceae bacterium]
MISALETILRHPRTVMIMMFMILGFGIATYIAIPKESDPDIDVPVFYVSVSQQGVSAHDAERLLVRPLETSLRSLEGLKEITGIASEGHAGIVLEFDISFDKDKAMADVRDKVDQAKAQLPADADEPSISETNFSLQPTLRVTLSGPVTERVLYQHALRLQDEIETISTVLEAELAGHREEVLEVIIDQVKLESYNITQAELINAVTQNHKLIPAGFVDNGNGRFNIKVPGLIETPEDVYSIPIKQNGEAVITLGNISEIRKTFKDPTTFTRVNGRPAIVIAIKKRIGTNIIKNNLAVREIVKNASKDWPETIIVGFMLDEAKPIFEILGSLQSSIMTAIFLVMIVVVAALGLKSALLIGFAIPTSFMTGFLILGSIGMTVNVMVMFGLVLTVGMLVDGAIVVVEYADRKMAEGDDPQEAYIRAA